MLLPHVRRDIRDNKRLHFALFQSLKKACYKPDAFYKVNLLLGFRIPGPYTQRELHFRQGDPFQPGAAAAAAAPAAAAAAAVGGALPQLLRCTAGRLQFRKSHASSIAQKAFYR